MFKTVLLTNIRISQLPTDYSCIWGTPEVITDSAPALVATQLNTPLSWCSSTNKPDVIINTDCKR